MPERPEDLSEPVRERIYPPIRGGGPGDGGPHTHNGGGPAIPEGETVPEPGTHTHLNGGTGPSVLQAVVPSEDKHHHFHLGGPTGPAIWTGPRYPGDVLAEADM